MLWVTEISNCKLYAGKARYEVQLETAFMNKTRNFFRDFCAARILSLPEIFQAYMIIRTLQNLIVVASYLL